jgi:hypothetical protein
MILSSFEMLRRRRAPQASALWKHLQRRIRQVVPHVRSLGHRHLPLAGEYFRTITKDLMG